MKPTKLFIMFVVSFFLLEDLYPDRSIPPKISIRDVPYICIFTRLNGLTKDLNLNTEAYVKDLILYELLIENLGSSTYSIQANKIGKGTFVQCSAPITGVITKVFYVISLDNEFVVSPVSGVDSEDGNSFITMLVPGMDLVRAKIITINAFQYGVFGRPTDLDGPFEIFEDSIGPRIRPVPVTNDDTSKEKKGMIEIGDTLELVKIRLEKYEKGVLAHPPADATWSHVWKVGNGLLAIEREEETDSVLKMGYILWPESETPVTIELSRISLNDGEMVMPIPSPPELSDEQRLEVMKQIPELRRKHIEITRNRMLKELEENGRAFFEENAERENVKTTESGLQYKIIENAQGNRPGPADIVTFQYTKHLPDGTPLSNGENEINTMTISLENIIPNLSEGIQLMPVRSKFRFWIPMLPPHPVVVFDVELINIEE